MGRLLVQGEWTPWTLLGVPGLTHLQGAHGPAARGAAHLFSLLRKQNYPHMLVTGKIKQKGDTCEALSACKVGGASHKQASRDHPLVPCQARHTCTAEGHWVTHCPETPTAGSREPRPH